jgi:regulatory protein
MAFAKRPPNPFKQSVPEAPDESDTGGVEYTRSSDFKKKQGQAKSGNSSFGKKKVAADPNLITRTSDRKPLYKPRPAPGAPREKPAQSCKAYAAWLLSRRDYSAGVLRNKLILRGYDEKETDDTMAFMVANGYQSDERYAQSLARTLSRRAGDRRLMMTMTQKKVSVSMSAETIDMLAPEAERVVAVAERFHKDIVAGGMTQKLQQKIYRFLAYRGFSGDSIKVAMRSLAVVAAHAQPDGVGEADDGNDGEMDSYGGEPQ